MTEYQKIMLLFLILVVLIVIGTIIWAKLSDRRQRKIACKKRAKRYREYRREQAERDRKAMFDCYIDTILR